VADEDKIEKALQEIGFCNDLRVKVSNGKVFAILKQVVQRPEKWGIKTQHVIDDDITR